MAEVRTGPSRTASGTTRLTTEVAVGTPPSGGALDWGRRADRGAGAGIRSPGGAEARRRDPARYPAVEFESLGQGVVTGILLARSTPCYPSRSTAFWYASTSSASVSGGGCRGDSRARPRRRRLSACPRSRIVARPPYPRAWPTRTQTSTPSYAAGRGRAPLRSTSATREGDAARGGPACRARAPRSRQGDRRRGPDRARRDGLWIGPCASGAPPVAPRARVPTSAHPPRLTSGPVSAARSRSSRPCRPSAGRQAWRARATLPSNLRTPSREKPDAA